MLRFWAKLGLRRRFLAYFLLGSIIPLLLFSFLFFHNTRLLLQQRNKELLEIGLLFSREIILDELNKLELTANQLASLPQIEGHRTDWAGIQALRSQLLLQVKHRDVDLVLITDRAGQPLAASAPLEMPEQKIDGAGRLGVLARKAAEGKMSSGIESLQLPLEREPSLVLVAAVPLGSEVGRGNRPAGALLVLKELKRLGVHSNFSRTPADLHMRVLELNDKQAYPIVNRLKLNGPDYFNTVKQLHAFQAGLVFVESIQGVTYSSLAQPLKNEAGELLGYQIISISKENLNAWANQNTLYIVLYLIAAFFLVTALGSWFNRTFILPINALAKTSEQVTSGDLDARVHEGVGYREMDRTLHNFNQMLDQLQEKENLRDTFISTLTHDLRTPLIAQKRVIDFLKSANVEQLDEQSFSLLQGLETSHGHLLEMINHLLEAFQYETGHIILSVKPTNLYHLVQECFDDLAPIAREKRIGLRNEVPARFELMIDARQFRRVIINLVGNSLDNICEGDEVIIQAEKSGSHTLIRIRDTGPGLPESVLPELFKRYPGGHDRQQKIGFGLGLYICKMIIELHGGHISADSETNHGTEFLIDIPKTEEPLQ